MLAAVAGASGAGTQIASPGVGGSPPVPKISPVQAVPALPSGVSNKGGGGVTLSPAADPGPTPSGGGTPLPGSTPDPVTGNSSGASMDSFAYFPVYVLDNQAGVVLYPGVEQLATLDGWMDLVAQVSGTTVSAYSWTAPTGAQTSRGRRQISSTSVGPSNTRSRRWLPPRCR